MPEDVLYLFGGDRKWDGSLWVASDDRVRGGASRSHLSVDDDGRLARFHGQLDIKTLGGAGFASQQSRPGQAWDLSDYDGIIVAIAGPFPADGKRYVLTLKDSASSSSLLPFRRHARQRASLSWEAAFVARSPGDVHLPWAAFTPTYRGRVVGDAKPLDRTAITQLGLMMRSFFGKQEGPFSLELHGIAAWKSLETAAPRTAPLSAAAPAADGSGHLARGRDGADDNNSDDDYDYDMLKRQSLPAAHAPARRRAVRPWWRVLMCGL